MAVEQAPEVAAAREAVAQTVANVIRSRRSINRFQPQTPPREIIRRALELARWAPNHYLTEPWHFYLLGPRTQQAVIELNAELTSAARGAEAGEAKRRKWAAIPGWLAVTCDRSVDARRAREDYAACACAIHNLALYLWSEGIGVKWTTGAVTREPRFYDLLWVDPEIEIVVGLLWYGYPDEAPQSRRRPLEQSLVELP
ncbi:MAG TPA: nitroreductase [Nitrococcus sp.]|nr:nitroreductase [Nitrococcus sp.]